MSEKKKFNPWKLIPVLVIIIGLVLFFAFGGQRYVSFSYLQRQHEALNTWRLAHPVLSALIFILLYIVLVAFSVPSGATIMTLTGGFLFGIVLGTVYVVFSATIGATIIFLIAKTAFGEYLMAKVKGAMKRMEQGFKENAFAYMLFLRLVPLFPFFVINIVAGLLNIRLRDFFWGTLLGIIPGTAVYASVGNGLSSIFERGGTPNMSIIFEPAILIPIVLLAILSIVPIVYKKVRKRRHDQGSN